MKKYRLAVFYFIALVVTLIYGNVVYQLAENGNIVAAGWMAGIPFGVVAFGAAWFLGKNESLY